MKTYKKPKVWTKLTAMEYLIMAMKTFNQITFYCVTEEQRTEIQKQTIIGLEILYKATWYNRNYIKEECNKCLYKLLY